SAPAPGGGRDARRIPRDRVRRRERPGAGCLAGGRRLGEPADRPAGGPGVATSLKVHYRRTAGDYAGWQIHTWNAAQSPAWNAGWYADGSDDFGVIYDVPLAASSGTVGYLFHNGDTKDDNGADQSYDLVSGANEIWRIQGDLT